MGGHIHATPVHITVNPTDVPTGKFLGASCNDGTLTVDRGTAVNSAKRVARVGLGQRFDPGFAISCDPEGTIHCAGSTDAMVYIAETDNP